VVIRLKVPIEMHYTVIPMGTSKVNSSRFAGFKVPGSSEDEDEFLSLHELQSCGQNNCVLG